MTGHLKNMLESTGSVHEYVVHSPIGVERSFAEQLERDEAVKVYAERPGLLFRDRL